MNTDLMKTMGFVGITLLLCAVAMFSGSGVQEAKIFDDKGQEFFPDFTDPTQPVSLEILEVDSDTASLRPFKVHQKDGRWSIPSHHDYPADAKDRMAEAAGFFVGLAKDDIRSDDPAEHALFGVVHPQEEGLEMEGRGALVTFKDSGGNELASLILGDEVEGKENMRYVRLPDKKRTYLAKLPGELTTAFSDWIETDLLQIASADLDGMVFDDYSVDESTGGVIPGQPTTARKKEYDWTIEELAEDEEPDQDSLRDAASTVDQLKIVGVRPKPAGLTAQLTRAEGITLSRNDMFSLQRKGYFFAQNGVLYSNEGDTYANTTKGLTYKLSFGEIVYGSGDQVTAGGDEEPGDEGEEGADPAGSESGEDDSSGQVANRYLMVTVHFDEKLLADDKPEADPLPGDHLEKRNEAREFMQKAAAAVERYREANGELPESLAVLTETTLEGAEDPLLAEVLADPWGNQYVYEILTVAAPEPEEEEGEEEEGEEPVQEEEPLVESFAVVRCLAEDGAAGGEGVAEDISSTDWSRENDLQRHVSEFEAYQASVMSGQEEAVKMSGRFAPWYYVIDAESFKKLRLDRGQLVSKKDAETEPATSAADLFGDEDSGD